MSTDTVVDRVLAAIAKSGETPEDDCFCEGDGLGYCDGVVTGPCVSCCPLAFTIFRQEATGGR